MASKENLIIHSLNFEIEIDSQEDFKHYADRISRLTNDILPARIDTIFNEFELPKGNLVIKKLSIDLGNIPPKAFENTIINAIVDEIESFLFKNIKKIKEEISKAQFKASFGGKYELLKTEFDFKSDIIIEKSTLLNEEIKIAEKELIILHDIANIKADKLKRKKKLEKTIGEVHKQTYPKTKNAILQGEINLILAPKLEKGVEFEIKTTTIPQQQANVHISKAEEKYQSQEKVQQQKASKTDVSRVLREKPEVLKENLSKSPKSLTPLDKAFIYYLKYGRLPSNVKYELGTSMLDVFNINQQDEGFLDELSNQIRSDNHAKERLVRLLDQTKDISEFDPKVPIAFEDYFTALIHGLPIDMYDAGIRRYDLNDMIRFLYADNPNKLRNLIKYLLIDYSSNLSWSDLVDDLFSRISKPSIVKLISSFVRKGAYLNKSLNELNRKNAEDKKSAHKKLFKLLVSESDTQFFEFEIKPRKYTGEPPNYKKQEFDIRKLIDYFFNNGSFPYSAGINANMDNLNSSILSLVASQISELSIFKNKEILNYETIGNLSVKAIMHLIKALNPDQQEEIKSRYLYFKNNINAGVPEKFQKSFMLYYALKEDRTSYLEEMTKYWKEQFGDSDHVIKQRWKVKEELGEQLNMLLVLTAKKVEDEIKVDYTYNNYANDISVKNAGLVILWPFLKVYFNMLELLNSEGNFRSLKERARACHLLQYLAIKRSYGEEFYYPLNKILTGYPLEEPLPYEITMTKKEIDVSNALLNNVLKQWNALKGGSVEGLRGSFLIRDGILTPSPNGWVLTVENKAYDILMNKLPWGIGMIKLSWAPYVLSVEWERNIM